MTSVLSLSSFLVRSTRSQVTSLLGYVVPTPVTFNSVLISSVLLRIVVVHFLFVTVGKYVIAVMTVLVAHVLLVPRMGLGFLPVEADRENTIEREREGESDKAEADALLLHHNPL